MNIYHTYDKKFCTAETRKPKREDCWTNLCNSVDVEENEMWESESSFERKIRGNSWEYWIWGLKTKKIRGEETNKNF